MFLCSTELGFLGDILSPPPRQATVPPAPADIKQEPRKMWYQEPPAGSAEVRSGHLKNNYGECIFTLVI